MISPKEAAQKQGVSYDRRTKFEVIEDLRNNGINAYPFFPPFYFVDKDSLQTQKGNMFPLAGVPNVTTVLCNESGSYLVYQSDRHGFNNQDSIYDRPIPEIALLGDSFTMGSCVQREKNVSGQLQELGFRNFNFGSSSAGPLIELAILNEYISQYRPKLIIWIFYEGNDLAGLKFERKNPILNKYLNTALFRQGLEENQTILSDALKKRLDNEIKNHQKMLFKSPDFFDASILKLRALREND